MSFVAMLDREVSIVPRLPDVALDARGNVRRVDGEPVVVRAMRDLVAATEEEAGADQQARTFRYFLPGYVELDGEIVRLEVRGYDRLVDDGETFEILGTPEVFFRRRRRRVHHVEALARLIEG